MEKAYDLKELAKKLEDAGLPVLKEAGEETAKQVYKAVKEWLKESAVISPNKLDDVGMPFIDQLDALVLPQIDKIDGQVG
jgi:hypothetical protein